MVEDTDAVGGPLGLLRTVNTLCERSMSGGKTLFLIPSSHGRWKAGLGTVFTDVQDSREDAIEELERLTR